MGMAARALLPSWFRRRRREARDAHPSYDDVPSPDEEREMERRRCAEERKRLLEGLRPRSRARRNDSVSQEQVLAREEAEKREWIAEQKRLVAEAMQRAGGPDPRWDEEDRRPAVLQEYRPPEKPLFPPGGYNKAPVRETCAYRFGPGSDAAFLESVIARGKSGGAWAAMCEAYSRRQRYLRDYCPFQREEEWLEEEEEESVSEIQEESVSETEEDEESLSETEEESSDAQESDSDATSCSSQYSAIGMNQGGCGHDDVYYAMQSEMPARARLSAILHA